MSYAVEPVSAVSTCSQKVRVAAQPDGTATLWESVSVVAWPYPSSHALYEPLCAASAVALVMTPLLADQDEPPDSKPGLASSCVEAHPPVPPVVPPEVVPVVVPPDVPL